MVALRLSGSYLPGFGSVTILVLLLGGIELIAIGIIGEYVGRIYDEVKGRPLYLVRARRNMPDRRAGRRSAAPAGRGRSATSERMASAERDRERRLGPGD